MPGVLVGAGFLPPDGELSRKTYAAGKIPGGFFRREGRPSEKETLTCRLIDRPIRPLFPKGFMNEVQVVCTVLSTDKDQDPDIAAMIGTSAALAISGIPFKGPLGAARVGYIDGSYILNPGYEALKGSMLNMMVAGTESAVLMVESEANEMTEDEMLGGVLFGHEEMQAIINAVAELAQIAARSLGLAGTEKGRVIARCCFFSDQAADLGEAYRISDKMERQAAVSALRNKAVEQLATEDSAFGADDVSDTFGRVEKDLVRQRVLNGEPRIDGRDLRTVRPIEVEVGVLPKAHGSALFTRGETQALVVATLGTLRDAALIDALEGSYKDTFMLHYNFPLQCG